MTEDRTEGRDADNRMPHGGALGSIDDLQGHPGRGGSPGPAIKGRRPEPDPVRVDGVRAREDGRPARRPGVPWWGHADKTSPWWAR